MTVECSLPLATRCVSCEGLVPCPRCILASLLVNAEKNSSSICDPDSETVSLFLLKLLNLQNNWVYLYKTLTCIYRLYCICNFCLVSAQLTGVIRFLRGQMDANTKTFCYWT